MFQNNAWPQYVFFLHCRSNLFTETYQTIVLCLRNQFTDENWWRAGCVWKHLRVLKKETLLKIILVKGSELVLLFTSDRMTAHLARLPKRHHWHLFPAQCGLFCSAMSQLARACVIYKQECPFFPLIRVDAFPPCACQCHVNCSQENLGPDHVFIYFKFLIT